ncbi:MAG: type II secretion system major pseudopilin GspG [Planctomycetales bacterium]
MHIVRSRQEHRRRNRAGFTLMEVLLVLAILGVIIALVVPNLIGAQKQANIDATKVQISGIEKGCEMYALHHAGSFPLSLEELVSKPGNDAHWKGPYLNSQTLPTDPWGNQLQYAYPGQNQGGIDKPDIWSMGPDRQANTADDITNWTKTQ